WAMLGIGFGALIAADVVLALRPSISGVMAGAGLWGLHMGFTQGVFAALVADSTPAELRGTGFGLFNLAGGFATLCASFVAGLVWDLAGGSATFLMGAILTVCA